MKLEIKSTLALITRNLTDFIPEKSISDSKKIEILDRSQRADIRKRIQDAPKLKVPEKIYYKKSSISCSQRGTFFAKAIIPISSHTSFRF